MDRNLFVLHLLVNEQWTVREVSIFCEISEFAVRRIGRMAEDAKVVPYEPEVDLSQLMPSLFDAHS